MKVSLQKEKGIRQVQLAIPIDLQFQFKAKAAQCGLTMGELGVQLIRSYLASVNNQNSAPDASVIPVPVHDAVLIASVLNSSNYSLESMRDGGFAAMDRFLSAVDVAQNQEIDGWKTWSGGVAPVKKGCRVDLKCRNGEVHFNIHFGELSGELCIVDSDWIHDGGAKDIVSWRHSKK